MKRSDLLLLIKEGEGLTVEFKEKNILLRSFKILLLLQILEVEKSYLVFLMMVKSKVRSLQAN
jgi:hypothetical protein